MIQPREMKDIISALKKYFDLGVDINCKICDSRKNGGTALIKAARDGNFKLCDYLIEMGAVVSTLKIMKYYKVPRKNIDKLFELDRISKIATNLFDNLPADKKDNKYRKKFKDLLNE